MLAHVAVAGAEDVERAVRGRRPDRAARRHEPALVESLECRLDPGRHRIPGVAVTAAVTAAVAAGVPLPAHNGKPLADARARRHAHRRRADRGGAAGENQIAAGAGVEARVTPGSVDTALPENAASHPSTPGLAGMDLRWPPLSTGVIRRLTIGSMFLLG
jgi:uncharacterized membrane protein